MFVAEKGKIKKLKIEHGQLVVLTFCFQFPLLKIQT